MRQKTAQIKTIIASWWKNRSSAIYSKNYLQLFTITMVSAAFTAGAFLAVTGIIIPKLRALTETTFSMPTDSTFIASGYDTGSGTAFAISSEVRIATSSAWWNANWNDKKQLTLTNNSGSIATAGATMRVSIDTKALYDAGKLLSTGDDLRVVYSTASGYFKELVRSLTPASGTTISTSTSTEIAFPLQSDITNGSNDTNYYLYYGNTSAPSYFGNALSFNGTSNYATIGTPNLNYGALTLEFLVLTGSANNEIFLDENNGSFATQRINIGTNNQNKVVATLMVNGTKYTTTTTDTVKTYAWNHIALVYDGSNVKVFINGNTSGTPTDATGNVSTLNSPIELKRRTDGVFAAGSISEIRLWNVARTRDQIRMYIGGPTVTDPSERTQLVGLWRVNEGSGSAVGDSSGNNANGSITGATWTTAGTAKQAAYNFDGSSLPGATFIAPFNGTTTAVGGQTPTTSTGAIRYSGSKSALSFDGTSDNVTVSNVGITNSTSWTIEYWLRPGSFDHSGQSITYTGGYFYNWGAGRSDLQFGAPTGCPTYAMTPGMTANTWYHVAAVRNGNSIVFYFNGTARTMAGGDCTSPNTFTSINLGNSNYSGLIDEVRISDTARYTTNFTPSTIPFQRDANTKLLLHFDENGDDPRNTGKAIDDSGNGNHGTVTGAKYVSGLVGVDASVTDTGNLGTQSYAAHSGVFIEEGTTNLITNPSFEHATFNTSWGLSYFNYATASATFTAGMAKRNSAGPFAAGVMVQGNSTNSYTTGDLLSFSRGNQIAGNFYQNYDLDQGSIVFWITPEWNGNDGLWHEILSDDGANLHLFKNTDGYLRLSIKGDAPVAVAPNVSSWVAGTTYLVIVRWDTKNKLDGTNYFSVTINNATTFGYTTPLSSPNGVTNIRVGYGYLNYYPGNSIIEGLTIYRRVLYEATTPSGINVGNGDEISQIYAAGAGKDPTLVTGSWDVVFALPTNASTGSLATGTGNAWSHPHSSNVIPRGWLDDNNFGGGGPGSIRLYQANSKIDFGSDAGIDNLQNNAVTWEWWTKAVAASNWDDPFFYKGSNGVLFRFQVGGNGWYFNLPCNTTNAVTFVNTNLINAWNGAYANKWIHVAVTYDNNGDRKLHTYFDGVETYSTQTACAGTVMDDSAANLTYGYDAGGGGYFDQRIGWARISNSIRYSSSFTPPQSLPGTDGNTVSQWNMTEGIGVAVDNIEGTSARDGTISNGTWDVQWAAMGSPLSGPQNLATSEKIYNWGYKWTNDAANEGIKYTLTGLTAGQNYVVRGLAHSDGTAVPAIEIWDATNNAPIATMSGTSTSTRTAPDNLLFTFELPTIARNGVAADSTSMEVRLLNTVASGTVYWHQVEVLENLIDNPSFETGSGDPWIPSGWTNGGMIAGQSIQETSIKNSGNSAFKWSVAASGGWGGVGQSFGTTSGRFYAGGVFGRDSGGHPEAYHSAMSNPLQQNPAWNSTDPWFGLGNGSLTLGKAVFRSNSATATFGVLTRNAGTEAGYVDDYYSFQLSDVSLTVTPATSANSTEVSGLRVDGGDSLTQPIPGLSATSGVIKFKFTPRHNFDVESNFGYSTHSQRIFIGWGDGSNYFLLSKTGSNTINLGAYAGGSPYISADWNSPTLNAGTTYNFEISYQTGGYLILKVNGTQVASASMGNYSFSQVPTTAYFGVNTGPTYQYEGTFSSFVSLTPTENSTAPYYKFGSKSVKLAGIMDYPDQYSITATASANGAYTLSAYVYNGTTVGGTVDATIAQLASGSAALTTTYSDIGGGWWRLTNTSGNQPTGTYVYGVEVKAGKTIYVDGVQLENLAYATTYADGSLGATGQYDWSGTANNSTSTRTVELLKYSNTNIVSTSEGSVGFWIKPNWYGNDGVQRSLVWMLGSQWFQDIVVNVMPNSNILTVYYGGDLQGGYSISSWVPGAWHRIDATWNTSKQVTLYIDGVLRSQRTATGTLTNGGNVIVGHTSTTNTNSIISDFRIYSSVLTLSQVKSLYYEGLNSHSEGTEAIDKYQATGTYTSPILDLTANGQWGGTPINFTSTLNSGTVSYLSRSSADNITWSDWASITGSTIASDPRRYFQWKALLAAPSGQASSPVVSGMTVSYVEDTTAPANPETTGLGYSTSSTPSADLTTATWYNYATPKFTFDAGLDEAGSGQSASGIAGYHILLTNDPTATPSANTGDPCYRLGGAEDRELIVGSKPATCTLSNGTYYLLMQAKDNSGNTAAPSQVFTYKYDGSIPNAPASVSTTNIGYQATNAFTFYWPTATDNGPSGIIGYEYKTATTSGTWSEWQYTTATTVADVPAYTEGQNFFYVRSKDTAGNYSGQTSNNIAAGSFYFNASAPTAPLDVVLDPVSSLASPASDNIFDVTWGKPATYSGEIAKYWYCVNCTPSDTTMTETTPAETINRKLDNYALATQQGKNTFYLVAEDNNVNAETGHGNRNFSAYATADFYASTTAPGAPTNLTISDASDRANSKWKLALAWDVPTTGGTPSNYEVYRSLDNATFTKIGEVTGGAYTDTGLTQSTLYYYKVRSLDNAGSTSLYTSVVSKKPEGKYAAAPVAGGTPSASAGSTTATITWTTTRTAYGSVEFGTSTAYGSAGSESVAVVGHSVKLTGLSANTTYHYRVQNLDDSDLVGYERSSAYSTDYTFTTLAGAEITDIIVEETGLDSAIISWKTRTMASVSVDYGKTTDYGITQTISTTALSNTHTARLTNLDHSTTYHFRIRGTTSDTTNLNSDDYTFQTITFPLITAYVLKTDQNAGGTTVALAWSTNVGTSSVVEYQALTIETANLDLTNLETMTQAELARIPVVSKEESQQVAKADLATTHVMRIGSLKDGSMYIFTLKGRDKYGNEGISDPIRYVTGRDTRPPVISNVAVETQISGSGAASTAQILVSWDTDEPATSQVVFGSGVGTEYPSSTPEEAGLTLRHVVVIRDLQPTASYHLQIQSKDQTGNQVKSDDLIAVTPATQESALDVVLKNLEDVFGFLKL